MQLPSFLRRKAESAPQAATTLTTPGFLSTWAAGGVPLFGGAVSEETALSVAAVYRCVTLISGVIASLDLAIYRDDPDLGQVLVTNKISKLFTVQPFPGRQMTAFTWKEIMVMNILLTGNHYSVIRYDQAGRVSAFEYAPPVMVRITRNNFRNQYHIQWNDGRPEEIVDQANMLHIAGPGYDGSGVGMSRIRQNARNSIALSRSIEEVAGKAFDNAMQPKMVLKMPPGLSPDAIKRLQSFMDNEFGGRSNVGKTLLVDAGTEVDAMSINVVDLALLEFAKVTAVNVCMWFGCPPLLLGLDQTTSWGSGISELLLAFLKFGLNSDLERIESELTSKLCTADQYVSFNREQLLSMDAATSAKVSAQEISSGVLTINEARAKRKRPKVEGGDTPLTNSTNIPLSQAIQPRPVPGAAPNAPQEPDDDNDPANQ